MGTQSQLCVGAIEKTKKQAFVRSNKKQKTITDTGIVGGTVGDGILDMTPCKTCKAIASGGSCKKKHDRSSPSCNLYNGSTPIPSSEKKRLQHELILQKKNSTLPTTNTSPNQKSISSFFKEEVNAALNNNDSTLMKEPPPHSIQNNTGKKIIVNPYLKQPPSDSIQKHTGKNITTNPYAKTITKNTTSPTKSPSYKLPGKCMSSESLSSDRIIIEVKKLMSNPSYSMNTSNNITPQITAVIHYILSLLPSRCAKDSNELMANEGSLALKQLDSYRIVCPPGTLGIRIPPSNKMNPPDTNYHVIEGRTIYIVWWGLNLPGQKLWCKKCGIGEFIKQQFDFVTHGFATPLCDISGVTSYAISMNYRCNHCGKTSKANDGELYHQIPFHLRQGYPVDSRYAIRNEMHLTLTSTRIMEKLLLTYSNGEHFSRIMHEMRGHIYNDKEEQLYTQAVETATVLAGKFISFRSFIGRYSPDGKKVRQMLEDGSTSDLNSTMISDVDRYTREIQGVIAIISSASDHTFAAAKNYARKDIDGARTIFTITTESGEIACAVVVESTGASQFSHALEQFLQRDGCCPKLHVTDNFPCNKELQKLLFHPNTCFRLGLFHFTKRITSTMRKEHCDFYIAVRSLSRCLYYEEQTDVDKVLEALRAGALAGPDPNSEEAIGEIRSGKTWKQFNQYIRTWMYAEGEIKVRMNKWFKEYTACVDPSTKFNLFTPETKPMFLRCYQRAVLITDALTREELYVEVLPSKGSRSGLTTYIGNRGVESKLEKRHHAIGHYANRYMKAELADALNLAGVARDNSSVRYRIKIAKMNKEERARINTSFHNCPPFMDESLLQHINKLGRSAGLDCDVHQDVRLLPNDTGEVFFSKYHTQQKLRNKQYMPTMLGQCTCPACAGAGSNQHKKTNTRTNKNDTTIVAAAEEFAIQEVLHDDTKPSLPSFGGAVSTPVLCKTETSSVAAFVNTNLPSAVSVPIAPYPFALPSFYPQQHYQPTASYYNQPINNWNQSFPLLQPNPSFCCDKYRDWKGIGTNFGRPPHAKDCAVALERKMKNRK